MSERQIGNCAQRGMHDQGRHLQTKQWQQAALKISTMVLAVIVMACMLAAPAAAQGAPYYEPGQLDHMVSRIALYPDPLLAQILAAATFPEQIPEAAQWADQHHYLTGDRLAYAIQADQLPWDPSVQALLPFPSVLDMMASDMRWTSDLGNAFLAEQQEVMYAVQRMRQRARDYGYLRTGPQIIVGRGAYITILPARPDYVVVPYYDPVVVYERPRPGIFVGAVIGFRFGVGVGVAFRPWGWGYNRIAWERREVYINNTPWRRDWNNRREYVHPYTVRRYSERHEPERHELWERSERERESARYGHERFEEHREDHRHDDRGREAHGHDDREREAHGHDDRGREAHGHDDRGHDDHHRDDHGDRH